MRHAEHILRSQLLNEGATSANVFGALGLLRGPDRPFPEVWLSVWLRLCTHTFAHKGEGLRISEFNDPLPFFLSFFLSSLLFLRFPWDRIKKSVVLERERERAHFWQFRVIFGEPRQTERSSSSSAPCYISLEEGGEGD